MPIPSLDLSPLSPDQIRAMLGAAWACRASDPHESVRLSRLVLAQPLADAELARASFCLGFGLAKQGEFRAAEPELCRALHLYSELGNQELRRDSLKWLGVAQNEQGRPVEALATFIQVRHLSAALGDTQGEITALSNIAAAYSTMGDHPNAMEHHLLALGLSR
ncbi:hypothetical protein EHF33_18200 (plasmid) [Deinococcus psychrotolerans]|uniref:Tetratricopeptide repeat protein n=1 Tax=Deinococcus psychrotolerans TaxID=2489213 RepID=A0A3G8YHX2_9DEIO|nr:tetratricopeptide repeat protein [Deinococcus psychrotolerans]AZI44852.1 hypothetical protein EHF33_18200 [Deinococcus psychrotolerans]